eukprot:1153185-Pelagomonas_calceolata.AAC.4
MASAPGFKLLSGPLIMLHCQILQGALGELAGGVTQWEGFKYGRQEGTLTACPCCKVAPAIWHRVLAEHDAPVERKHGLNW